MKVKILTLSVFVFSLLLMASGITAQTTPKILSGGVLNGKAVNLVKPEYPPAARAVRASGAVNVQVTIDEEGNVINATVVSGHPLLRNASETAAKASKFSPTRLDGQLVRITGVIVYNFASEGNPNISGGLLNSKALTLPKPEYSAEAKKDKIEGTVNVRVLVDEEGNVVSATAVSGPPQLREASEKAALAAKFTPVLSQGTSVKMTGILLYNFTSGQSDAPRQTTIAEQAVTTDGFKAEILNGKAKKLPAPDYPPAARAVSAGGKVNIQVTVDEAGNVIDAKVVSGHPLLRASSLAAAKEAKFAPTVIDGKAVKVTGVIIYNFDNAPAVQ